MENAKKSPDEDAQKSEEEMYQTGYRGQFSRRAPGEDQPKDEHPLAFEEPTYEPLPSEERGGGQKQAQQQMFAERPPQQQQERPRYQQSERQQQQPPQQGFTGWQWQQYQNPRMWGRQQRQHYRQFRHYNRGSRGWILLPLVLVFFVMMCPGGMWLFFHLFSALLFGGAMLFIVLIVVVSVIMWSILASIKNPRGRR